MRKPGPQSKPKPPDSAELDSIGDLALRLTGAAPEKGSREKSSKAGGAGGKKEKSGESRTKIARLTWQLRARDNQIEEMRRAHKLTEERVNVSSFRHNEMVSGSGGSSSSSSAPVELEGPWSKFRWKRVCETSSGLAAKLSAPIWVIPTQLGSESGSSAVVSAAGASIGQPTKSEQGVVGLLGMCYTGPLGQQGAVLFRLGPIFLVNSPDTKWVGILYKNHLMNYLPTRIGEV